MNTQFKDLNLMFKQKKDCDTKFDRQIREIERQREEAQERIDRLFSKTLDYIEELKKRKLRFIDNNKEKKIEFFTNRNYSYCGPFFLSREQLVCEVINMPEDVLILYKKYFLHKKLFLRVFY